MTAANDAAPQARLGRFFAVALVAATMANGAAAFLKRIGALEPQRYESYWQIHCGDDGPVSRVWGLGRRCPTFAAGPLDPPRYRREQPHFSFVFEVRPSEIPLKVAKDLVLILFVGVCLWRAGGTRGWRPAVDAWPLWAFGGLVIVFAGWGIVRGEGTRTLLGLRGMTFIAVGLLGTWITAESRLHDVCRGLIVLLLLQLVLFPAELLWGMPMAGYASFLALPSRLAGTLVKANGLGVLAAVVVGFSECFAPDRRWRTVAWLAGIISILLAGSATGCIVLLSLALFHILRARAAWRTIALAASAGALLLLALPAIVGRPNLLDSITGPRGRLDLLRPALSSAKSVLLGRGFGSGTNVEQVLVSHGVPPGTRELAAADSTPALLLGEFGVTGVVLFYAGIAVAWRRDAEARPLLLALVLTSLTCNLPEAFPVNFLLGLGLAHGLTPRPAVGAER